MIFTKINVLLTTYFTRFQIVNAPDLDAVALETEMGLRLPLRSLVWELMGDDYGTRAVSLSVNLGKCHDI